MSLRSVVHYARAYRKKKFVSETPFVGSCPPKHWSMISDETGKRDRFKECYHATFVCKDNDTVVLDDGAPPMTYENDTCYNTLAAFPKNLWRPYCDPQFMAPEAADMEAFNKRAYSAMQPGIEVQMDVPTFLAELSSLPDLFKSGLAKRAFEDVKNLVKHAKKVKGKDSFTKLLAGDYLNTQFGWKPTIADAKALYDGIKNIDEKLKDLIARQNTVQSAHYSEEYTVDGRKINESNQFEDRLEYEISSYKMKLTATMKYSYKIDNLEAMSKEALKYRAYLDMLGFNNPLRTIWELIPFSFVLDWFIPVGNFLEQFAGNWIQTTIKVRDYCISYKTVSSPTCTIYCVRGITGKRWETVKLFYNLYCRFRSLPNDDKFGLRLDSRYGTKQMVLSGALAAVCFGK